MQEEPSRVLQDPHRLSAIERTALLDSPAEEAFDRVTRLAMRLLHVPISLVSVVDGHRQFFKSCVGLPEPWLSARQMPLSHSFCQHVVTSAKPLLIDNARENPLVRDNLAVRDIGVVAYIGAPLTSVDGHTLGTVCSLDTRPRNWSQTDVLLLSDLAAFVMSEIKLRDLLSRIGAPGTKPSPPARMPSDDSMQQLIKTITERIRQQANVDIKESSLTCLRCREARRVEEIDTHGHSTWFRCTACGHVWQ